MKKIVCFLLFALCLPFGLMAQSVDDDLYFVPSKDKEPKTVPAKKDQKRQGTTNIYTSPGSTVVIQDRKGNSRSVDEYNRRYDARENNFVMDNDTLYIKEKSQPDLEGEWITGDFNGTQDDYDYAERIIRFRNPRFAINISSPLYWDVVYGPNSWDWNVYTDGMYAYAFPTFSNSFWWDWRYGSSYGGWGWNRPYYSWGGYYPGSWGGYYGSHWGGWHGGGYWGNHHYYPNHGWGGGYRDNMQYTNRRSPNRTSDRMSDTRYSSNRNSSNRSSSVRTSSDRTTSGRVVGNRVDASSTRRDTYTRPSSTRSSTSESNRGSSTRTESSYNRGSSSRSYDRNNSSSSTRESNRSYTPSNTSSSRSSSSYSPSSSSSRGGSSSSSSGSSSSRGSSSGGGSARGSSRR